MALLTPNLTSGSAINDGVRVGNVRGGSSYINNVHVNYPTFDDGAPGIPIGITYPYFIRPVVGSTGSLLLNTNIAAAGVLTLTAGAGVTLDTTTYPGYTAYSFDVARTIAFSETSLVNPMVFIISGWDMYGIKVVEQFTLQANTAQQYSKKAFKAVHTIQAQSASGAGLISIGQGYDFGMPFVVNGAAGQPGTNLFGMWGGVLDCTWDAVNEKLAFSGVVVPSSSVFPSTAISSDVRGTYRPGSIPDGTKSLVVRMTLPQIDPIYTRGKTINPSLAYGFPQYSTGWL